MAETQNSGYTHPEVLVETSWVADHLNDSNVRLIEADEDVLLYEVGHIPGAVKLDWHVDVQAPVDRDFLDQHGFEQLMSRWGITKDTTIVLYGDRNNWYAAYSFWLFTMYGHKNMKLMNGGRTKWEAENRPMTKEVPHFSATEYHAQPMDESIRAYREDVASGLKQPGRGLIDVRSPQEYTGELLHMVNYPQEGAQRGGHISRREEHSLVEGRQRKRHLQVAGGIAPDLRLARHFTRIGCHFLLPYW